MTSGLSDYISGEDLTGDLDDLAYAPTNNPPSGNKDAAMTGYSFVAGSTNLSSEAPNKMRNITDGTSNTMLIMEYAGREKLYAYGKPVAQTATWPASGLACFAEAACISQAIGANGWAFHTIAESRANGAPFGGTVPTDGQGPCAINCSNPFYSSLEVAGMYSFHTGMAHALMADGAVRGLSQNIGMPVFGALYTKAGGEVTGEF